MKTRRLTIYFLFLLFLCLTALSAGAQESYIDSLVKVSKAARTDTAKIHALHQLVWEYRANEPDKALNYAQEALKIAVRLNDRLWSAKSFGYLAIVYKNSGNYNQALQYNLKALKVYQEKDEKMLMSDSYNNLGNIYLILGRHKEAIESYNESIRLCDELGVPLEAILPLNNMGEVYRKSGDWENANQCFTRALKLARLSKDESMIVYCLSNMGYIFEMQGQYDSAFKYYHRSMNFNKSNKDFYSLSYDYAFMGRTYKEMEDYDNALDYLDSALALIEDIKHPHALAEFYIEKGSIYREAGKPGKAKQSYNKAYTINKELGLKMEMAKCLDSIGFVLFYEEENITGALETYSQALELCQEMGDSVGAASSHFQLGSLFIEAGKYTNAERHLLDAEKIARTIRYNNMWSKASLRLSELYTLLKKPQLSSRYLMVFDSLEMADYGKMQFKYKTATMEREAELKELQLRQKQIELYTSIIIAILLLLLSLWIFNFYRQKKKANELLLQQKAEITEKNERLEAANKEISRQKDEIEDKNKNIVDSINYAKRLQFALLPLDDDFKKLLPEAFIFYSPKDIVSGDFYFLERMGDRIFFAVADCTGHGVPGAFVSFVGHEALSHAIDDLGITDPGKILDNVRQQVEKTFDKNEKGEVKDGMDVSLGVWNIADNTFYFSGAHHTMYWISVSVEGPTLNEIKGDRYSIGAGQGRASFTTVKVDIKKGDLIYFSSDGYADQFGGPAGKKFKTAQFKTLLLEIHNKPADAQKEILHKTLTAWRGAFEQVDDVCVVGVKI